MIILNLLGNVQKHKSNLSGTLRFETILPNISFEIVKIKTIPVLSTPLSIKLARRNINHNVYSNGSRTLSGIDYKNMNSPGPPQFGYVTLNQTRKIIPLLENDPIISIAPLVGVWTAFNDVNDSILNNYNNDRNSNNNDNNNDNDNNNNDRQQQYETISNIRNPLTWAISIRFLFNEHIKDRAFVDKDTFLLVRKN